MINEAINIPDSYSQKVKNRSFFHYVKGLIARYPKYIKCLLIRKYAIYKGASIGEGSSLTWNIAKHANKNLIIGNDCIIEASKFDLRGGKIIIHDHVIINKDVTILRVSHYIDDNTTFTTRHYKDLHIHSYSWIATGAKILPQVLEIGEGAICGAYSVISKNCEADGIYVGNPAIKVRNHNSRFSDLLVCSLQGCDYKYYKQARK